MATRLLQQFQGTCLARFSHHADIEKANDRTQELAEAAILDQIVHLGQDKEQLGLGLVGCDCFNHLIKLQPLSNQAIDFINQEVHLPTRRQAVNQVDID